MPSSKTHNEITLRPPPGTRFSIFGSDVRIEFQRGKEREIVTWLHNWIDMYIEPEARKFELKAEALASNSGIDPTGLADEDVDYVEIEIKQKKDSE